MSARAATGRGRWPRTLCRPHHAWRGDGAAALFCFATASLLRAPTPTTRCSRPRSAAPCAGTGPFASASKSAGPPSPARTRSAPGQLGPRSPTLSKPGHSPSRRKWTTPGSASSWAQAGLMPHAAAHAVTHATGRAVASGGYTRGEQTVWTHTRGPTGTWTAAHRGAGLRSAGPSQRATADTGG